MKRTEGEGTIDSLLLRDFIKETNRLRSILKRILDVTLFLADAWHSGVTKKYLVLHTMEMF